MNVMRNLALITIILLFLIIFNSITKIFTRNNCVASYIGIGSKKEMNKSDYYIIFYAGFLILSFVIVPKLLSKNDMFLNILLAIFIFGISGYLFGFINTHLKYFMGVSTYDGLVHNNIIRNNFLYALQLLFLFSFYTIIKQFGLYI